MGGWERCIWAALTRWIHTSVGGWEQSLVVHLGCADTMDSEEEEEEEEEGG